MIRKIQGAAVLVIITIFASDIRAQSPQPVPVALQAPAPAPASVQQLPPRPTPPALQVPAPASATVLPPPPPPGAIAVPAPASALAPSQQPILVDQGGVSPVPTTLLLPANQQPGLFGSIEVGVLAPHLSNGLTGSVNVLGFRRTVDLPIADLDWTGSPKVEIGYRLPNCAGEFILGYRSVVSEGSASIRGVDPAGQAFLQSRLNANIGDIDYHTGPQVLAPFWDLSFRAGVRIAGIYYDSQATGRSVGERATSNFVGAGPHAGVELARQLDLVPGLALFGRLDGGLLFGEVSQSFEQTILLNSRLLVGGASRRAEGEVVPVLTFLTGFSYSPPASNWLRFSLGYQFEQWWDIGNAGPSTGDLRLQGLFFRGEFNF